MDPIVFQMVFDMGLKMRCYFYRARSSCLSARVIYVANASLLAIARVIAAQPQPISRIRIPGATFNRSKVTASFLPCASERL